MELTLAPFLCEAFAVLFGMSLEAAQKRRKSKHDPVWIEFERAWQASTKALQHRHPDAVHFLFVPTFMDGPGTSIIGQLTAAAITPDLDALAIRWAETVTTSDDQAQYRYVIDSAKYFLKLLNEAMIQSPTLAVAIHHQFAASQADSALRIAKKMGADKHQTKDVQDYLRWTIRRFEKLDNPIIGSYLSKSIPLKEVYVSLRAFSADNPLIADTSITREQYNDWLLRRDSAENGEEVVDFPQHAEDGEEVVDFPLYLELSSSSNAATFDLGAGQRPVDLAKAVSTHAHVMILGDPGAGKSTTLRYLALQHCLSLQDGRHDVGDDLGSARLPIFASIRRIVRQESWRERPLIELIAQLCHADECRAKGLIDLFEARVENGEALILLDGLDEASSLHERVEVLDKIKSFLLDLPMGNKVIVTSRIAGYYETQLPGLFQHYIVEPMNEKQVLRFLQDWCHAMEQALGGKQSRSARHKTAEIQIAGLSKAMTDWPAVRALASSPLLLGLMALIYRTEQGQLPERRVELYETVIDILAFKWYERQGVTLPHPWLKGWQLEALLSDLAFEMHRTESGGVVSQTKALSSFVYSIWENEGRPNWQPSNPPSDVSEQVESFLRELRRSTGLVTQRIPDHIGFKHATFEEFFAAIRLNRIVQLEGVSALTGLLRELRVDPRWQESILLLLGMLNNPIAAGRLVEESLWKSSKADSTSSESQTEMDQSGRGFLIALRCLSDQVPLPDALVSEIIVEAVDRWNSQFGISGLNQYNQQLLDQFILLKRTSHVDELAFILRQRARTPDVNTASSCYRVLLAIERFRPSDLDSILEMLSSGDEIVALHGVGVLSSIGARLPIELHDIVLAAVEQGLDLADRSERHLYEDTLSSIASGLDENGASRAIGILLKELSRGSTRSVEHLAIGWARVYTLLPSELKLKVLQSFRAPHSPHWDTGEYSARIGSADIIALANFFETVLKQDPPIDLDDDYFYELGLETSVRAHDVQTMVSLASLVPLHMLDAAIRAFRSFIFAPFAFDATAVAGLHGLTPLLDRPSERAFRDSVELLGRAFCTQRSAINTAAAEGLVVALQRDASTVETQLGSQIGAAAKSRHLRLAIPASEGLLLLSKQAPKEVIDTIVDALNYGVRSGDPALGIPAAEGIAALASVVPTIGVDAIDYLETELSCATSANAIRIAKALTKLCALASQRDEARVLTLTKIMLRHDDERVRMMTAANLASQSRSSVRLLRLLRGTSDLLVRAINEGTSSSISWIRPPDRYSYSDAEQMRMDVINTRDSVYALGSVALPTPDVVETLLSVLNGPEPPATFRSAAATALVQITRRHSGPETAHVRDELFSMLESPSTTTNSNPLHYFAYEAIWQLRASIAAEMAGRSYLQR